MLVTGGEDDGFEIDGIYKQTDKKEHSLPVWHNADQDTYIFASDDADWHISDHDSFYSDDQATFAHSNYIADIGCPHDTRYLVSGSGKEWRSSNSLAVREFSGKKTGD